ncbi:MAG: ATPase [Oscillospiraceae bacterium]
MNVNEILDSMDDMLDNAWSVPLSGGRCVVDIDRIRELIDDIRLNMPAEIKQAKLIVSDRKSIVEDARREGESIIRIAEERASKLIDHDEISKQAEEKAKEMLNNATRQCRELKKATNEFIESNLKTSEELMAKNLQEIRLTRQALRAPKK